MSVVVLCPGNCADSSRRKVLNGSCETRTDIEGNTWKYIGNQGGLIWWQMIPFSAGVIFHDDPWIGYEILPERSYRTMYPSDFSALLTLVLTMFPNLHAIEANQIAHAHVMWHEAHNVDDSSEWVCKAQIRSIVQGKRLHVPNRIRCRWYRSVAA